MHWPISNPCTPSMPVQRPHHSTETPEKDKMHNNHHHHQVARGVICILCVCVCARARALWVQLPVDAPRPAAGIWIHSLRAKNSRDFSRRGRRLNLVVPGYLSRGHPLAAAVDVVAPMDQFQCIPYQFNSLGFHWFGRHSGWRLQINRCPIVYMPRKTRTGNAHLSKFAAREHGQ